MVPAKLEVGRVTLAFLKVMSTFLKTPSKGLSGVDIMKVTGLPSGTVYPLLARLLTNGYLDAEWEDADPRKVGRRPKRLYRLTKSGEKAVHDIIERWPLIKYLN
jgi:PadR family transcriptional regulator PadR